jgi:hypothetical protein
LLSALDGKAIPVGVVPRWVVKLKILDCAVSNQTIRPNQVVAFSLHSPTGLCARVSEPEPEGGVFKSAILKRAKKWSTLVALDHSNDG